MDRLVLVSADCHGGAPWEGYRRYVASRHHADYDTWLESKYATEEAAKEWRNAFFSDEYQQRFNATAERRGRPSNLGWEVPVGTDEARMEQLEGDGVVAEFVFPDGNRDEPPWRGFMDVWRYSPELRLEGARAWNRWMAELASVRPGQHVSGVLIGLEDIDAALVEIEWGKDAGLHAILPGTPPEMSGLPPYSDPRYEPLWSASVAFDMPVNFHTGSGGPDVMAALICTGVFDRHPDLKVVFTEQGIRWAATLLAELEDIFDRPEHADVSGALALRPSEYFARNCWLGHSGAEAKRDWELRHVLGVDKIMWGSDFPHPEGWWPETTENLHRCFETFDEEELRRILGENIAELYGLDLDHLRSVAERTGPKVGQVI